MSFSTIAYENENNSFQKFLSWTDEKEILGKEIRSLVKPSYKKLLDIGANDGTLTAHYIDLFKKAILLEPSKQHYDCLCEKNFSNATILNIRVEDFKNSKTLDFDLIVASHVFIYLTQPYQIIDYLYSVLRKNGRIVFIMIDRDCSYVKFVDEFSSKVLGSQAKIEEFQWGNITAYLKEQGMSFKDTDIYSFINAPSIEDFLSINDFNFNADVRGLDDDLIEDMKKYLSEYTVDNYLRVNIKHKIIVAKK